MSVTLRRLLTPLAIAVLSPAAMAQLIEDIDWRQEGGNAVVNIRFVTAVQLQKVTTSRGGDLAQAFYTVLPTREFIQMVGSQRKVPVIPGLPDITVTDESVGRDEVSRRLIVRLSRTTPFRIRSGKGNSSLELVFAGQGEAVSKAEPAAKPGVTAVANNFLITLQSSANPGEPMRASVPAKLQDYQMFTARRTVDGQTIYDINLGYFASRPEAEAALALLRPRFPQASVVALGAGTSPAPVGEGPTAVEVESKANELMASATAALARGEPVAAVEVLSQLLLLPPNGQSRSAQEQIGMARMQAGDTERARAEFDTFLALYPTGADSDRVRQVLASLPVKEAAPLPVAAEPASNWSGSIGAFYFGGKSKERSQEFQDSPISGLPTLLSDNTISDTDQGQFQTSVDLNWRKRDAESDSRFVFRDAYTENLENRSKSKNRLTALYYSRKSLVNGSNFRIGRQSPVGGGILYRFDGVQAGYTVAPKWRVNAAAGVPTDDLLQTRRSLYSVWVDADALTSELSGSLYVNQQMIDGEVDRRAIGVEMRYFSGGVSVSSQFDHDTVIGGLNIASVQGTWQLPDNTIFNFLYDRRTTPLLSLGNILFFQDPFLTTPAQRIQDLLATTSVDALRDQVKAITAYQKQAAFGVTTPLNANWQVGGNVQLTNVGEVKPVPVILPSGQPSTGNLWSVGGQLIGSNLYSQSDTHVFLATGLKGPTYKGLLLSYNNLTSRPDGWRLEPSLRYYRQTEDTTGIKTQRWTPGMRVSYRIRRNTNVESELSYEMTKRNGPLISESSDRLFYYLGARYDF